MENNMIFVASESDHTIVINLPDMLLHRTWTKRGQKFPFERAQLEQAFYDPSVEFLFKSGFLVTSDKQFLKDVGLMTEEEQTEIVPLTEALLNRMIKLMPLADLKVQLSTLSQSQLLELGEYAISHYGELKLDRVDLLSKATGKDILKAIENYKKAQED